MALPLSGLPAPRSALPVAALPTGYRVSRFKWHYHEKVFSANGDGAARTAYPDSARFDFVVGGNTGGGGHALLFDSILVAPGGGGVKRYLPTIPLLWGALGRLAVPPSSDTVVRVEGDTIRTDIGPVAPESMESEVTIGGDVTVWRAEFVSGELTSVSRLRGGRVRETVRREVNTDSGVVSVKYESLDSRRSLTLTQVRSETVPQFDPTIWIP
jgi:hypothetical protein